jgi:hypothetical protein
LIPFYSQDTPLFSRRFYFSVLVSDFLVVGIAHPAGRSFYFILFYILGAMGVWVMGYGL